MKIFLAGTSVSNPKKERKLRHLFKSGHKLHSYFHKDILEKKWFTFAMENKIDLFLDSGAFSAWTQKQEINIDEYISFIKENENIINVYANLDVIGNPAATWKNQMYMERNGTRPLPTFHYGEDTKWLRKILSKKYEYICLGGMVPIATKELTSWLDFLFSQFLTDEKGIPICKVHGFGLTSLFLLMRYPWFSVDSTSWVVTGRMGGFFMPYKKKDKWVYDENSWKISISNKSPNLKEKEQHFQTMSPEKKKIVLQYLEEKGYKIGISSYKEEISGYKLKDNEKWAEKKSNKKTRLVEIIEEPGLSNTYQLRDEINIIYFQDLEKSLPIWPHPFKKQSNNLFMI